MHACTHARACLFCALCIRYKDVLIFNSLKLAIALFGGHAQRMRGEPFKGRRANTKALEHAATCLACVGPLVLWIAQSISYSSEPRTHAAHVHSANSCFPFCRWCLSLTWPALARASQAR